MHYLRRLRDDVEIYLDERILMAPLRWKRPRRIFVCSMTDLFGEWVPSGMIDRVWAIMRDCPQHTFQVLTKRADHMRIYGTIRTPPLPNVWLGVSVEDQRRADERTRFFSTRRAGAGSAPSRCWGRST